MPPSKEPDTGLVEETGSVLVAVGHAAKQQRAFTKTNKITIPFILLSLCLPSCKLKRILMNVQVLSFYALYAVCAYYGSSNTSLRPIQYTFLTCLLAWNEWKRFHTINIINVGFFGNSIYPKGIPELGNIVCLFPKDISFYKHLFANISRKL